MIWRRILSTIPVFFIVSFSVFVLESFIPGDPAVTLAGENASAARIDEMRQYLNLDDPLPVRYVEWLGDAVRGDWGESLYTKRDVMSEITSKIGVDVSLVIGAVTVAIALGIPLGILAGSHRGGPIDRAATLGATLGVALPQFVVGIFLIVLFAIWLKWLPIAGYSPISDGLWDWGSHLVLPVLALAGVMTAELTRQLRSSMADTLETDYIRTARAKGLRERAIIGRHALRVAISPAIAVLAVQIARLLGGAVIVEQVFALPGIGVYTITAITNRDLPAIRAIVPLTVVVAVAMSLVADLIHLALNPKVQAHA